MLRFAIFVLFLLSASYTFSQANNADTTAKPPGGGAAKPAPAQPNAGKPALQQANAADTEKAKQPPANAIPASGNEKPSTNVDTTGAAQKKKDSLEQALAVANKTQYIKSYDEDLHHPASMYAGLKGKGIAFPVIIGFLLVAGTGIWLLSQTALCRDICYKPETSEWRPLAERPYSFARVQLFWWTVIILSCYVAFYMYTGYLVTLPPSSVYLLGGGLAVAVFGKMIDNTQMEKNKGEAPIRHQDIAPSQGLFIDILSDEGGISIHRFQSVIFNLVFGIAYIKSFLVNVQAKQFPFIEFESWQLAMLGISTAAYLGFKTNENSDATKNQRKIDAVRNAQAAPPPPPPPPGAPGAMVAPAPPVTNAFLRLQNEVANL